MSAYFCFIYRIRHCWLYGEKDTDEETKIYCCSKNGCWKENANRWTTGHLRAITSSENQHSYPTFTSEPIFGKILCKKNLWLIGNVYFIHQLKEMYLNVITYFLEFTSSVMFSTHTGSSFQSARPQSLLERWNPWEYYQRRSSGSPAASTPTRGRTCSTSAFTSGLKGK